MDILIESFKQSVYFLFPPKKEVIEIIFLSLFVSCSATLISSIVSIPLGIFLSLKDFKSKKVLVIILQTLMSIPSILIGLLIYLLFCNKGIFNNLKILYTPYAIIIAQSILATPIISVLVYHGTLPVVKDIKELSLSLGANFFQTCKILLKECRGPISVAMLTGFSRVIGETGMTLMVGGNIKGFTRVLTTAIAIETMKGNFELSISLGIILFLISVCFHFLINIFSSL